MDDAKIKALFDVVKKDIAQEIIAHLDTAKASDTRFHDTLQLYIKHGVPLIISSVNALDDEIMPVGEWVVSIKGINEMTSTKMEDIKIFLEKYIKDHIERSQGELCSTPS